MTKIEIVVNALEDINAFDIIAFDTKGRSPFFDHFVISSVTSDRQLQAAINHITNDFKENGFTSPITEGKNSRTWVLIDCGDVIVNVFTREERDYYNMEKMWVGTEQLDLDK